MENLNTEEIKEVKEVKNIEPRRHGPRPGFKRAAPVAPKKIEEVETPTIVKSQKEKSKELIEKMRKRDSRMVRGRFVYHEVPGGKLTFTFKAYPGDRMQQYELTDGEIVSIPLGVANHLNTNVCVPEHRWLTDENGRPKQRLTSTVRRVSFQPLDFSGGVDDELELPQIKSIITVENV